MPPLCISQYGTLYIDPSSDDDLASLANELGLDDAKASPNATIVYITVWNSLY